MDIIGHVPPLSPLYDGPYKVVRRLERSFRLQIGSSTEVISIDRLKPHRTSLQVFPAQPPRRGRPPNQRTPLSNTISLRHTPQRRIYKSHTSGILRLGGTPVEARIINTGEEKSGRRGEENLGTSSNWEANKRTSPRLSPEYISNKKYFYIFLYQWINILFLIK